MGVNDLWSILSPVKESVPLYSLSGKTLAVDLSLWICEAQHVQAMMGKVTKPHLRNLFFRASSLLRMGIKLVFVMEGEAPKIKAETMSKRTGMAFRGSKTKSVPKPATAKNTSRGRFKAVLRECAEMLDYLGIPWVSAAGEAEAMCAFLDAQGLVDGCITSDGDAFLYGAQTVYRNFNMNTKDPQIDCYKMSRVETELQLKRETLVGLAVLLGCDYIPKGVPGVGKEQALKLIQNLKETTLLQKFSDWRKSDSETQEFAVKKVTHCLVCRHPGSAKAHERSGCVFCDSEKFCQPQDYDSQCPCDWHRTEHARQASSVETVIKKKTLACDMFPFTEIINEFLVPKDKAVNSFKRRKPNLLLMQNFALDKMEWPKHYTSEKVLALMTYTELMNRSQGTQSSTQIQPIRIYKRRIRNGISCFEIMWRKPDHYVFPEDCPQEESDVVRTVEEENLFTVAFPDIVQLFHKETAEAKDNKLKKKKPKAEKEKPVVSSDGVSDLFAQMSLKGSSHPDPLVSSGKDLRTITVLESDADHCSTATLTTASKLTKHSNCLENQSASGAPLSSFRKQPEVLASPCHTETLSQAQSSLSVSVVIDQLHLSSIDWDALSFTAAASPQSQHSKADPQPENKSDDGTKIEGRGSSTAVQSDCVELAAPKTDRLSECSLRERVHLRNIMKCSGSQNNEEKESKVQSVGSELKYTDLGHKPLSENPKVPDHSWYQKSGRSRINTLAPDSKDKTFPKTQRSKDSCPVPVPLKYKFVKPKHFNRPSIDPEQTNKESACKKSVCRRQGSSSDDSDVENQPLTKQQQSKLKANLKPKPRIVQKTVLAQQLVKQDNNMFSNSVDTHHGSDSTTPEKQPHNMGFSRTNPITQTCSKKSDDDSDASICSPLPLAERLKLKFNK
ncbi:flap endonuclease GEN homolog 1 [Pangasianodon hypophthalmus]|uniref:flap endonuclease GEN homolog 1 n=1 Tax=Pangasianodon hypophthalmus TaxID=310915 RepID=UPI0023082D59|nr:flap endonuclease GEN homolog 1 [Pangasianodon hypophthalmus]XP_026778540.3 flap endonuclease GEN homolog 1 [Pangasianodon hypophthalmus]XP_053097885.1 flap endonuclease GEN homolog 1 [Pangasianodon hypophthalmus]